MDISQIDAQLAAAEAAVGDVKPGCEKRVVWAGDAAARTATVVIYVHGFSASAEELRPLPDLVANGLGANLFFTRLQGHGRPDDAMLDGTFDGWRADIAEVFDVASALGDEIILIGCSTGCTMIVDALARGAVVKAAVFISPNFGLKHKIARMVMNMPFAQIWAPWIAGKTQEVPVHSPAHKAYWAVKYPMKAAFPMAQAVRAAMGARLDAISVPGLFAFNAADTVVDPVMTHKVMRRWGGPVQHVPLVQGAQDDAMGHVMAGDVFSPGQTAPLAETILEWVRGL